MLATFCCLWGDEGKVVLDSISTALHIYRGALLPFSPLCLPPGFELLLRYTYCICLYVRHGYLYLCIIPFQARTYLPSQAHDRTTLNNIHKRPAHSDCRRCRFPNSFVYEHCARAVAFGTIPLQLHLQRVYHKAVSGLDRRSTPFCQPDILMELR